MPTQPIPKLVGRLKRFLEKDKDTIFGYLYGSVIYDSDLFGADIDLAVYLKPTDMNGYIKKEDELIASLTSLLETE